MFGPENEVYMPTQLILPYNEYEECTITVVRRTSPEAWDFVPYERRNWDPIQFAALVVLSSIGAALVQFLVSVAYNNSSAWLKTIFPPATVRHP